MVGEDDDDRPKRKGGGAGRGGAPACCCMALFGPFYLLYSAMNRKSVLESTRWAGQPWTNVTASVVATGSEYTGDCWTPAVNDTLSKPCSQTCVGQTGYEWFKEVTSKPGPGEDAVAARRLRGRSCDDSYLPWAAVQLPNSNRVVCAFQYGIGDFEDIRYGDLSEAYGPDDPPLVWKLLKIGSLVTVHSLALAPCVVAFGDPRELVKKRRDSDASSFNWIWIILPCSICGWLFIGYVVVMSCYQTQKAGPSKRDDAYLGGQAAENLHRLDALSTRLTLPPGHWSQWDGDQVVEASEKLFTYFDKDRSGYLDVEEMVSIMAQLGIQDRHLVLRTMVQLDSDESGVIERSEFEDLCRQIFWNGHRMLVAREFARQQEVMGNQAISASGLSKNLPLVMAEVIVLFLVIGIVMWLETRYGHRPCDTRFDRYLIGAVVLVGFQIVLLFTIACGKICIGSHTMCLQGAMVVMNLFVLTYAIAGTAMWFTSEVCDPDLRTAASVVVIGFWVTSLYVLSTAIAGFVAAYYVVKKGSNLNALSLDEDPDSDSEYEEVDIE